MTPLPDAEPPGGPRRPASVLPHTAVRAPQRRSRLTDTRRSPTTDSSPTAVPPHSSQPTDRSTDWLCLALHQLGRPEDELVLFERTLTHANDLGLFAEELSLDGEQLGNFRQAFTTLR